MVSAISALDMRVLETLYTMRDPSLVQVFIWVSELGRAPTVYGIAAVVALLLILKKHYSYALGLFVATTTSGIGIIIFKGLIERARPPLSFQAYAETWYSFPSAHAALSVALYGFLIFLSYHFVRSRFMRSAINIGGALLIGTVIFSRLYLGVHYMSDVVAGALLGIACVWLGIAVTKHVQKS